jgi:ketosteroid isomerase-like protein
MPLQALRAACAAVTHSSVKAGAVLIEKRRTPAEVSHRFAEAINARDLEGALECWSPDAVIVSSDGSEVRGHDALAERFRQLIAVRTRLDISVSDEVCTELGASATTRMKMTVPTGDGPTAIEVAGVVVYVPGPGGLQIFIDQLGHGERALTTD